MTNIKKLSKRGLALLITLVMCLGLLQLTAFAANEADFEDSEAVEYVDTGTNSGDGTDTMIEEEPDDTQNDASVENGDTEDDADVAEDVVPEDDANIENTETDVDAEPENSVSESVEVDVPSAQVQAFLSAVAALPGTVTEENAEEVFALMQACQDAYDALSAEDMDRADVSAAVVKMAGLMEPVDTLVLIPTTPVAKIGDQEYTILSLAVAAAQPGDTIVFQADIAQSITVSKDVTFDLNGYSWTGRNDTTLTAATSAAAGNFTVTVKNGSMTSVSGYRSIETQLPSTVKATNYKADVVVENMTFTTSGSISSELSVSTGSVGRVGGVIYVENGNLTVTDCTFTGAAGVSGSHIAITPRTATVYPEVNLTISNSTFEGADSTGAVWASALGNMTGRTVNVNITGSTFTDNKYGLYCKVDNSGSAANITANLEDCTFTGSTGSAIYTYGQTKKYVTLNLKDTKITDSIAQYGGLYAYQYTDITMTGGKVSNITGTSSYGAIESLKSGSFKMDGTVVSGNTGYRVVHIEAAPEVSIQNAGFSNNTMTTNDSVSMGGGGTVTLKNSTGPVTVSNTKFTDNYAKNYGGGLCVYTTSTASLLTINGCTFTGNTSDGIGGGIYLYNKSTTTIKDTTITGNTANSSAVGAGAGLYVGASANGATVNLTGDTRIYKNETPNATVKTGLIGVASEICIANSSTITMPLNIEDGIGVVEENGNTHTLTKFNGTLSSSTTYRYYVGYYTNTVEPVRVYLGTAEQHTSDTAVVTSTLAESVEAAKEKGLDIVYICGDVKITAADEDVLNNSGITFARCANHPNSNMFTISGTVTLNGAQINGMNVLSNSAMISVPADAHLIITGDTVIENGKNSGNGGAIYVSQGQLTMNGGTITNNTANQGGGIYAIGGKLVSFEGGTVSKNVATGGNGGGGAYIEATSSEFGVDGGRTLFDGNSANQLGGGVFLVNGTNASTHHYIYKATFTNNSSYRFMQYFDGGAIYIQSGTTAHMKNVYVSGNKDGDGALDKNGFTAVAVCPTGELAVYELDGLLSVNNGHNPDIGVIAGGAMPSTSPKVYLASHAPGGGEVSYTLSNGTVVDTSKYQFMEGYFRLYTSASDSAINAARETAERDGVIITGNYATQYGSGIMTNGILKIGTETVSLKVVKEWADGADNHDNDQILVYLTKDGEIVDQDFRSDSTVILNKDNNWSYTWTNLGDQFTWGVKEASVGGYASEVKVEKDTQFGVIADKYYIATITNTPGAETHKLSVTKTAYGLDPDASYKFTLKLDNVGDSVFALQLDGTLYPIYNNEITFYLKDGQSAVVDGLPEGFTYEVTEEKGNDYNTYVFESITADTDGSIYSVNVVNVSKTDIEVEKQWADSDDDAFRPEEIKVDLLANGEVVETTTIRPDDEGKWVSSFTDLPEYDAAGEKIVYTVKEQAVSGYDSKVEGWLITNTLRRGSLTINKAVVGGSADASTEKEYTFIVSGPNEYYEEVTINGEGSVTISGLLPGIYTVTEDEVSAEINGYSLSVAVDNGEVEVVGGETAEVTFTNTYTPDNPPSKPVYTSLTVNKVWEDEGNEDIRPDSIQVQLYRNGNAYGNLVTLDETNGWSYHWTNLTAGVNWTAEEVNVPDGYTSSTTQAGTVVTITNTYVPEEDDEDKDEDEEEDLDDPDVPLTDLPDDPEEEELDDPDVPLGDRPDDIDEDEELDDPDVPLTDLPEIPEEEDIPEEDVPQSEVSEEVPEVEIFEEDVPLAEVPKTGDNFSNLWYALTAAAAAGLMALKAVERKKREED